MWEYSSTEDNWKKKVEKLDKRIYNFLRQEIEDVRFYSKCLDGTSYVASQDLDDIYDVLKYKSNLTTYKVDNSYSSEFNGTNISGVSISPGGFSDVGLHYRYNQEYGFTLKNLFSPSRLINDSTNYLEVDVATTESFNFNNIDINSAMSIDGVILLEGHRVLIKDNVTNVTLNSAVDPATYFSSNYYTLSSVGSTITYYYYNTENGVYLYTGGTLVRESDLDNYLTNIRYSVNTKLGTNVGKQFHLSRLLSGYYPLVSNTEPIEFTEKSNYLIRNSVEYRNVLDNQFYCGTIQQETSIVGTETFRIPHRFISIGDFGFILNKQNDYLNVIKSKYKEDLRDIIELYDKYLIIGKNGTLISMDKVTLVPDLLELDTFQNFKSIDFIDDNRGLIVGENGTIVLTQNQYDWNILETNIQSNLNKVKFTDLTNAVTVGNNGTVNKLSVTNTSLEVEDVELSIKDNLYDSKPVIRDLVDIDKLSIINERFKFIGNDWIDITKNIGNSNFSFDFRFKSTSLVGSQTIFSFLTEKFPSSSGTTLDKGIRVILEEDSNNEHRIKMYVNDDADPTTFITLDGDINVEQDKWYHVFVTRDKETYNLVVDQKLADTTTIGFEGSFDNFSGRIRLGAELTYTDGTIPAHSSSSFNQFVGSVDHVRLWNKKLDDTEIEVFSNNYKTDLSPSLLSWYKFNVYKPESTKLIRTRDLIDDSSLILPSSSNLTTYNSSGGTTMIDTENFTGFVVSGENLISLVIDTPEDYSDQILNTTLFIESTIDNINNVVFNSDDYLYCSGDKLFRLDIEKFEFDLFNQINTIDVTEETLLSDSYNSIKLDEPAQILYLVGGSNNQIETIDISSICSTSELDPIENCGIYSTVSFIGTTNSITIENDYRNDVYLSEYTNCVNYIKTSGYPGTTQSVLEIPIENTVGLTSSPIDPYTELYLSLEVEDLINGSFEISLDNVNFTELDHNGEYLIPLTVGGDSKIHIRAVLSSIPNGDKIKGFIKNMLLYDASCVQISEPETYTGGTNIKKLYFTQFDTSTQLMKLNGSELYSYIDLKSLKISDVEQISTATFSAEGFPSYLYPSSFATNALVNCDVGGLCDYVPSLTNNVIDRIQYGFGLEVTGSEYTYVGNSYGLLEALTINTNQIFGLDRSGISNGTTTVDDPVFAGIDFTKSFEMEVDSMIIDSGDLLNSDISNGYGSQSVVVDATTFSYGTPSGTFFNQLSFTASTSLTYSITTDEQLNQNQTYYIEFELDGAIQIDFASQSFTYSATGSIVNDTFRLDYDQNDFIVSIWGAGVYTDIDNLVLTDRLPTKSVISWDPDTCQMTYKLNGVVQTDTGFLQEDGDGQFAPSCTLNSSCDNSTLLETLVDEDYWDTFKSKLLFLDYDMGSKLYFFDLQTGDYQLPDTVDISSIEELKINSISGEKSWIDYSKDTTKEFQYWGTKNDANIVEYSSTFTITSATYSYDVVLNGNSSNDLTDVNGATYGLLPPLISASSSFGTPSSTHSYYFYGKYMIIRQPVGFVASLGDIIRLENNLITANMMVISTFNDGTDDYLYLNSNFNQSITNSLTGWTKATTITNLNLYDTEENLISNFNNHPISVGYILSDNDDGTITVDSQFNTKTAYYNLQCSVVTTDTLSNVTTQNMNYINKVSSFGYSPTYNILDYLSKNPTFDTNYIIGSLPSYSFSNSNAGVIYTVSTGQISFNSSFKDEWESIPKYTFVDMTFGADILESVLVIDKSYDSTADRYIIQTYNYFGHVYDQSDLADSTWELRVRNTLGEISADLQKINNIQRSSSLSYHITDLSNNVFTTYTTDKSELNFKPNTDSYAKALLSQKEVKEYLTGIIYTDYKNELALNIVNLSEERNLVITGIEKYDVDCDGCEYEDYVGFENPGNSNEYNQFSRLSDTNYYTNRIPVETYGYNNQIQLVGATGGTQVQLNLDFVTQSGSTRVLEFNVENLTDADIKIIKDSTVISTISTLPNSPKTKIEFSDNGASDLLIRIAYTAGDDNLVEVNDIRIGNDSCVSDCYLAQLKIPDHGLIVGDGIIVDIDEDIYNLNNLYVSDFDTATNSMWIENIGGTESFIPVTNGAIGLTISSTASIYYPSGLTGMGATQGQTYRLTFDYKLDFVSGTPSLRPAFATMSVTSDLPSEFDLLSINGQMTHVESNFIPTGDEMFVGFNITGEAYLTLNNISIDLLSNRGQVYDGFQVVQTVVDNDTIVIDIDHTGNIEELSATYSYVNNCGNTIIGTRAISDIGEAIQFIFDPYLNYAPIDLFDLGNDNALKKAIEIKPDTWVENSDETISLVDLDMANYRFRLVDGLSLVDLNDTYPWILESEIREALIGKDENGIVWYKGIWDCGRWFGGTWYSGDWRTGEWYDGTWNNSEIEDNQISAEVSVLDSTEIQSTWYSGSFRGGTWNNGVWRSGNHYDGVWENGEWNGGTWHLGTWNKGLFKRGTWIDGTWENGIFNCDLGASNWLDGTWNGGDFECGRWYSGRFDSKNSLSRFGTNPDLSRQAIWENGSFINGEFYSGATSSGGATNSRHDLSIWNTGFWNNGTWNGGTAHQINWNNGTWNDGVVKEIKVVAFVGQSDGTYFFTLEGDWQFKVGDIFWIIDNETYNDVYGSDTNQAKYKVDQDYITINSGEYTKVLVSRIPTDLITAINNGGGEYIEGYSDNNNPSDDTIVGTQLTTIVSYFSQAKWYNGQWQNGIFDGTFFRDGIWEKGVFKSGDFGY